MIGSRRSPSGFTLVETLVAVSVFALLMTSAWDLYARGILTFRIGTARLDALHEAEAALESIKAELREAVDGFAVECAHPEAAVPRTDTLRFERFARGGDGRPLETGGRPSLAAVTIRFDPARRAIVRSSGGRETVLGLGITGLDVALLRYPAGRDGRPLLAVSVEVRQSVDRESVPLRALVVPRLPGSSALDPDWVFNASGDTVVYDFH